ncbi:hypothetical protein TRVA0_016S00672 [Trichomonascus vanleenenianus]|uniref:Hsp20/alpha crystallin family protein n=1 Tax=Trichomonascus vanleenenianus TaxID=2268995 RepID=UPI003ECAAE8E
MADLNSFFNHPFWDFFDTVDTGEAPRRRRQQNPQRQLTNAGGGSDVTVSPNTVSPLNWFGGNNWFSPPIDLYEKPDSYVVVATVAGAKPSDIKVDYDPHTQELSISGEISSSNTEDYDEGESEEDYRKRYLRVSERRYGSFERRIRVPNDQDIDVDHINAEIRQGVLRVVVPKKVVKAHKKKSVNVKAVEDEDEKKPRKKVTLESAS